MQNQKITKNPIFFAVLTIFKGINLEIRKIQHIFATEIKNLLFNIKNKKVI